MGGEPPSSVMVAVRCRPFNQRELDQQEGKVVRIGADGYCALQPANEQERLREFSFDYTYDEDTLQTTVYEVGGCRPSRATVPCFLCRAHV